MKSKTNTERLQKMARNNQIGQERNPLKMVLYITAVLLLLGCIGYLLYSSAEKKKAYREEMKMAAALETEILVQEETEEQTEAVSEVPKKKETAAVLGRTAETRSGTEKTDVTETETADSDEASSEKEVSDPAAAKEMNVLVLNGTKREGVAGYWKTKLEQAGYTHVYPVTYTKPAEEQTVIYAKTKKTAEAFLEQFPNAKIEIGTVKEGWEAAEEAALPVKRDVFILIGLADAP